jgi:hypothetical protein
VLILSWGVTMPETFLWGERGLVAALFLDLANDPTLGRWRQFLRNCFEGQDSGVNWEDVNIAWAVVEPSFGSRGFGNPDAVFRLDLADGRHVVGLLEAKLGVYQRVCRLPMGRGRKGFNSMLNGQVELNHCFTLALSDYRRGDALLIEPEWLIRTPYAAARPHGQRYLANSTVLKTLVNPLRGDREPIYLHIVLTSDLDDPLADDTLQPWWPEIFVDAESGNAWGQGERGPRFGWTSWSRLHALDWRNDQDRLRRYLSFNLSLRFREDDDGPPVGAALLPPLPPGSGPVGAAQSPPEPPGSPGRGVSLIYAPAINKQTFLHFSWRGQACCLRDYTSDPPSKDRTRSTLEVRALINREEPCGARRPCVEDCAAWRAIIDRLNQTLPRG